MTLKIWYPLILFFLALSELRDEFSNFSLYEVDNIGGKRPLVRASVDDL